MGRKKIQKAPKPSKAQEPEESDQGPAQQSVQEPQPPKVETASKPTKAGRKGKNKQAEDKGVSENEARKQVQLFPQDFKKRINDFKSFYSQYLQIRSSSSDVHPTEEYKKVSDSVRSKIQVACSKVFRENVADAQKWIQSQKSAINQQIRSVQQAKADLVNVLKKSGTFTQAQINSHVSNISKKKQALQQSLNALERIRQRAAKIYQSDTGMDEQ